MSERISKFSKKLVKEGGKKALKLSGVSSDAASIAKETIKAKLDESGVTETVKEKAFGPVKKRLPKR
ncbi:MAG: hypothetical protein ACFFFG_08410 [Candidatus Thorarchaeota archaeon]